MRPILAAAALAIVACSPSTNSQGADAWVPPTDARVLPDDGAAWSVCVGFYRDACTSAATSGAERLYTSAASWSCLNAFDVPESQREAARACICTNIGSLLPASIDTNGQRAVRAACCGRSPAPPSAWCADAGP